MAFNDTIIGTCSLCGGPVGVPSDWMATIPPTPTCGDCGAVEAPAGPVIQMKPAPKVKTYTDGVTRIGGIDVPYTYTTGGELDLGGE